MPGDDVADRLAELVEQRDRAVATITHKLSLKLPIEKDRALADSLSWAITFIQRALAGDV